MDLQGRHNSSAPGREDRAERASYAVVSGFSATEHRIRNMMSLFVGPLRLGLLVLTRGRNMRPFVGLIRDAFQSLRNSAGVDC